MKRIHQGTSRANIPTLVAVATKPVFQKLGHAMLAMALSAATFQSALAQVNLATAPVFLKESVDPNLMFIYDDSGSMARDYMPDNLFADRFDNWFYSSRVNQVYYDPTITYNPPYRPDGSGRFPDSEYTDAWVSGFNQGGARDDLSTFIRFDNIAAIEEGFYMQFNSSESCDSNPRQDDCYTAVLLNDASDAVKRNYANWFSYYRTRVLASRSGITEAFFDLPENIRVGYGAINSGETDIDGVDTDTIISGVRPYTAQRREEFLGWLQARNVAGGTPLRTSLEDAGEYYSRTDNRGPWGNVPGTDDNDSAHIECRPSYSILMTDGIYNGGNPSVGNADGTAGPSYTNPKPEAADFNYTASSPFTDSHTNTLADVAMRYWKTDLRPTIANRVPTAGIDEAFWQHMTTFTIGLGVEGQISEADAFKAIQTGDIIDWPEPNNDARRIDDLLHAAVNGRGGFASAQNPDEFSKEIGGFLDTVIARAETSATAAAVSSAVLRTESAGFFAGFRSVDWSGTLIGFGFDAGEEIWDAEEILRNTLPANRNILTHNGSTGVELKNIIDLSAEQILALNVDPENPNIPDGLGSARIDWIRGAANANAGFRDREFTDESGVTVRRLLGDIINANPLFVGNSNFGFTRLPGDAGSTYAAYRSTTDYQDRTKALYVAANDGMLHSFDSETGEELFAYMPGELLNSGPSGSASQISSLMSPNYTHRYFVDGTPKALDAYITLNGVTGWRTILVGTMGAGGRTVFAIDITNPDSVTEDSVLWEFTHPDLGFGVTDPEIARLPTGDWVAIFGNGYNGTSQESSLFVVNLADGSLIKQLETGVGGIASPNGLAAPVLTNFPDRGAITNYVYAGDLLGNLWRFSLVGNNTNQWSTAKVFSATDPDGAAQPITVAPRLTINPSDLDELILNVGTGSFIRTGDAENDQVQTLYTIQDDLSQTNLTRSDLLQQTITDQQDITPERADGSGNNAFTIRKTSSNALTTEQGWFLDLIYNGEKTGERVISRASYPFGIFPDRVRFSTLIPDSNPCGSGRKGFIMDLKLVTGAEPETPVFDLNSDGIFNTKDLSDGSEAGFVPSGISLGEGAEIRTITTGDTEAFITDPKQIDDEDPCDTATCGRALDNNIGRQTWEQLR